MAEVGPTVKSRATMFVYAAEPETTTAGLP